MVDAQRALARLSPVCRAPTLLCRMGAKLRFRHAGHILRAPIVEIEWAARRWSFPAILGHNRPPPRRSAAVHEADYLLVESTYGDRRHDGRNPQQALAEIIERTVARGGTVVIPAFAEVGRAQALRFHLSG